MSSREFLNISSGVLTLVFAGTLLTGFQRRSKMAYFDELTVRRFEDSGTGR